MYKKGNGQMLQRISSKYAYFSFFFFWRNDQMSWEKCLSEKKGDVKEIHHAMIEKFEDVMLWN